VKKKSKRYNNLLKKIDLNSNFEIESAVDILKDLSGINFIESVEVHAKLGVDSKQADQQVRGTVVLPNGTGKNIRVLVITKDDRFEEAKTAGADYVGNEDILQKIKSENWFDFDCIVTTPEMMVKVSSLGKILGPKGLMPNPKSGTITNDIAKTIKEIKLGKIEYKLDKSNIVHAVIGKVSFGAEKLVENFNALLNAIVKSRPSASKGKYIKSLFISSTMGPGIKLNISKLI
jgi:large subunit ribosomal protein L1